MTAGQIVVVPMPHMGVSVEDGVVVAWHKAPGDSVHADEPLCDIATDKVDTEVGAPADGVLARIVAPEGTTVAVGDPIAELAIGADPASVAAATSAGEGDESDPPTSEARPVAGRRDDVPPVDLSVRAAAGREAVAGQQVDLGVRAAAGRDAHGGFDPDAAAEAVVAAPRKGTLASPVARRLAAAHGVDLATLRGNGRRGRIRKADVLAAIEREGDRPTAADLPRGYLDVPHEIVPTTRVRQAIAEHMIRSRQTAAHMTTEVDVDLTLVTRARLELNDQRVPAGQPKLSYLPFIARATCAALVDHPDLNASFQGDRMIRWRVVNLGVAVDTSQGLLVPVVRDCHRLTAPAIGAAIAALAERARAGTLVPDDLAAGTFTLSNPGSAGAVSAPAIINQPQVGILGVPAIQRLPWVTTDPAGGEAIAIRPILRLALTFDHRAVDGAGATRALVAVKDRLESWRTEAYV